MARRGISLHDVGFAFGLYWLAKRIEAMGDMAPAGSGARLGYHLLALGFVVVAIALFGRGGIAALLHLLGRTGGPVGDLADSVSDQLDDGPAFDPDDALARYWKNRPTEPQHAARADPASPPVRVFGRKRV